QYRLAFIKFKKLMNFAFKGRYYSEKQS
ncbi:hypothetical protein G0Y23_08860, partial [Staphylococcus aureus]|nr:hypothetical protein [Staphylococcus aureus]NGL55172.1 hypothetical protein [Staphylococcus aureus]